MTKFSNSHLRELALLAQLVERFICNEEVTSLSLVVSIEELNFDWK